ncbi:MAG: hypothetical protein ACJA0Q_001430 [Saprospiraceae bacterium]|jgi:hypothetical protein
MKKQLSLEALPELEELRDNNWTVAVTGRRTELLEETKEGNSGTNSGTGAD